MGLLMISQKEKTLLQLATGSGKSSIFGILAKLLNLKTKKKVVVVVPTDTLAAV